MAYKLHKYCLRSSFIIGFLLLYQLVCAQYNFSPVESWVKANLKDLGGRAVIMIYKDGKVIYNESFNKLGMKQKIGARMIARKTGKDSKQMLQDYDDQSRISLASCSKWLSAALVMTFVDEGKLSISDTIGKFLPVMTANGKGAITIAQCLSHTTGIKGGSVKESKEWMNRMGSMDEAIALIAKQPVESAPGQSFHYSSIGLQLAAAVIENISGKDFETLFAERIARPCDMIQTDFGHKNVPLPAGGAQGSASDYLNFLQMILHKGIFNGKRVLSARSIELMQQDHKAGVKVMQSPAGAGNWGYGFGEWTFEETVPGKPSDAVTSPGLFGSFPWVDNKKNYAALLFTFNLKYKGRNERYKELKSIVDSIVAQ